MFNGDYVQSVAASSNAILAVTRDAGGERSEGAGAADDADRAAGQGDLAGGDADVALAGADDAGAVRPEQPGAGVARRRGAL